MSNVHPIFDEALKAMDPTNPRETLLEQLPAANRPLATHKTSSVIIAAIKTSNLTVNEIGNILGAITDVLAAVSYGKHSQFPELQGVADDLSEACEDYLKAQLSIDERLYEEHLRSRQDCDGRT